MKTKHCAIDSKTRSGSMTLVLTCPDDAYTLSSVLAPGDTLEATTTRKLSLDGGRTQQKITLTLAIRLETAAYDLINGTVDAKGRVSKENEHVRQGSYHTLNLATGDTFTLTKETWSRQASAAIKDACKDIPSACVVVMYDRDCVVSTVSPVGIVVVHKEEIKKQNYRGVAAAVARIQESVKTVVIAGLSDVSALHKALVQAAAPLQKKATAVKLPATYRGLPNSKTVGRMLVDPAFARIFAELDCATDLRDLESFLRSIDTGTALSAVGLDEVMEALEYGALKTLFLTDAYRRPQSVAERRAVDQIVAGARQMRARVCVVPAAHESGARLQALGGIACLLLFNYK